MRIRTNETRTYRRWVAVGGVALLLGACSGEPEVEEQGQNFVFAIPAASAIAMAGLKKAADKVVGAAFDWWWNSLLGIDPAGDLQRNFDAIKNEIATLQNDVKNLTVVTKQAEVDAVGREAERDRSMLVRDPLGEVAMNPAKADGYIVGALSTAHTWLDDYHNTYAGTGVDSPTRFDFRIAAPLAVEATNAWLTFRMVADTYAKDHGLQRRPMDEDTRKTLREIAYSLDAKVQKTLDIVHCDERRQPIYRKDPGSGTRKLVGCTYFYSCEDGIAQTFEYDKPSRQTPNSPCQAAVIRREDDSNARRSKYNPWPLRDIANKWHEIAGW
jgi:hypothetical protein